MTKQLRLSGHECFFPEGDGQFYKVKEGTLLVYLYAMTGEQKGRKLFLAELPQEEIAPVLDYSDETGVRYRFLWMALDRVTLCGCDTDITSAQNHRDAFAKRCGLKHYKKLGFEEALAETYRMEKVKEDAFIYQAEKDRRMFYEAGLDEIGNLFLDGGAVAGHQKTRSPLYNAISYICEKKKIPLKPLETVRNVSGSRFTIEDVARVSDFIVRKVTPEEGWYHWDGGMFLTFLKENSQPVVCEPKGSNRYFLINIETGEKKRIGKEEAETLSDTAYILYRPLPAKKMTLKDVFLYTIAELSFKDLARFICMSLIATGVGLLLAEANRMIYDQFLPQRDMSGLLQVGGLLIAFSVSNTLFGIVGGLSQFRFTANAKYQVQAAVYHRLLNLPQNVFNGMDSGDIATRATGASDMICGIVGMVMDNAVSVLMALVYLWRMISFSTALTFSGIWMVLLYLAITYFLATRSLKYSKEKLEHQAGISSSLYQYISGIEKIRLSGTENNILYRYLRGYTGLARTEIRESRIENISAVLSDTVSVLFSVGLYLTVRGSEQVISAGAFVAFGSAFGAFTATILSLGSLFIQIRQTQPEWSRMKLLFETLPESAGGKILPGRLEGEIHVEKVSFSYPGSEETVLQDLSLHIAAGEYVGIVGASGCGKSTLMKLLLGFEQAQMGKIYYDGNDLDLLDKRELRNKMGVVLQDGSLISGSIAENIQITALNATIDDVMAAAKKVGLEQDIMEMPMGLHTVIGDENTTISGGQKQRILIARALVSNPSILLLDEATSALDNITQRAVCDTLETLEATRIVIAHRLSTVVHCDRIIVLDHGRIVEEGTYDELIREGGLFARMAERQIA